LKKLTGVRIGERGTKTKVTVYADEVTVIITQPGDIPIIQEAVHLYELATGAKVNTHKSKALALGSWNKSVPIMNINYSEEMKILGFHMHNSIKASVHRSWTLTTAKTRTQAQDAYHRAMSTDNRIRYICDYLLARTWYLTQTFPPPDAIIRQMNTTISSFLWHGEIFRVPLATLYRPKEHGGWGFINPASKCLALFIARMQELGTRKGTVTADLMRIWRLQEHKRTPPHHTRTPNGLEYLNRYYIETAYLPTRTNVENSKAYKRRLYTVILTSKQAMSGHQQMRVENKWPHSDWPIVCTNLRLAPGPASTEMTWRKVIHDIIPTNERLHQIKMAPTDTCRNCAQKDTLKHRLIACGGGRDIWRYAKALMARMLRTTPNQIQDDWILHPQFQLWPPKRRNAILWVLANIALFRTQQQWHLTLHDFMDFLKRSRWKQLCSKRAKESVGNYLIVMD
jgi:hypothetical protein